MSKAFPDFSLITFVAPGKRSATSAEEKVDLSKFFEAVINCQKLEADQYQIEEIFCNDLLIDIKKLDKQLISVLAEALIYYMSVWPGWRRSNEYFNGQLQCKEWFERFRQYLIFKSNFIIKNAVKFSEDINTVSTDASVQTDAIEGNKKIAPYTLVVGGPPSVLNNVVFMENNGNVLIKQHIEKPWRDLTMIELFNWPFISVEVKLPDISITRNSVPEFQRYVSLCGDISIFPETNTISHIKKTEAAAELQPYTYEFIECYIKQLQKTITSIPDISAIRILELRAIFSEFLADIAEANVYSKTLCPNISIKYHIGKFRYIRNKKMVSSSKNKKTQESHAINFYEIIIPQAEFILHNFKAVQDLTDKNDVTFVSLNRVLNKLVTDKNQQEIENLKFLINNTCVVYNCVLCMKNFSGPYANFNLTKHFSLCHKAEQSVLCPKCRRQLEVKVLAGQRWKHVCQ